jgi:hypothetical protein
MSELCRRGWGDWTWRRCVCVEVELLVNCATLLHNVVLQNNVSYMWLWRTTHLKTFLSSQPIRLWLALNTSLPLRRDILIWFGANVSSWKFWYSRDASWQIGYQLRTILLGEIFWVKTTKIIIVLSALLHNPYHIYSLSLLPLRWCGVVCDGGWECIVLNQILLFLMLFNLVVFRFIFSGLKIVTKLFRWRQYGWYGKLEMIEFLIRKLSM